MIWITQGRRGDFSALGRCVFHTVRSGATAYTVAQRHVWVPHVPTGQRWHKRLSKMTILVARSPRGIQGFVAMAPSGYVDFAYVVPFAQGRGVFRTLMAELILRHPNLGMWTHASLHAQPAFHAVGFQVVAHETVARHGQRLRRAHMVLGCP